MKASALFVVLAAGTVACSTVLGDFPEGKLITSSDGDPPAPDGKAPDGDGFLCTIANAGVLDFKVDDTNVYWLRAAASEDGGQRFAVESCAKNGGQVRPIATVARKPEALALSDNYVFWSINESTENAGGVWRARKSGGSQEPEAFLKIRNAGPVHVANNILYTGTPAGTIHANSPDTGAATDEQIPNIGNPGSMAVSESHLYWSDRDKGTISKAPRRGTVFDVGFVPASSSPRTQLAHDNGALHWVTLGSPAVIASKCPDDGCSVKPIVIQPSGFDSFAVRNGHVYWTVNENGTGTVQRCTDLTRCEPAKVPFWSGADTIVSHIALDGTSVYFVVRRGADSHIVKRTRGDS